MLDKLFQYWKQLLIAVVVVDVLAGAGLIYLFVATNVFASPTAPTPVAARPVTPTPTPWAGPPTPVKLTPTPPGRSTPTATPILAESGFPYGFTPTPRPTRAPVFISLPKIVRRGQRLDLPTINQVLYPEPFFPPGTNNACGPIALYSGILGLGVDVDYGRLRDHAVSYGFDAAGISTHGMINTASALGYEMGTPFTVNYGWSYNTNDLIKHINRGEAVIVLIYVLKIDGQYRPVTSDTPGSFGHFLLVERISTGKKMVTFAGSTLGMEKVSLGEFLASWTHNPYALSPAEGFKTYLKNEPAQNWALFLKRT